MAALTGAQIIGLRAMISQAGIDASDRWRRLEPQPDGASIAPAKVIGPGTAKDIAYEIMLRTGRTIRAYLRGQFPGDAILAKEEELRREGTSGRFWIINPLDGSHNFAKGSHEWSISVALYELNGTALFGCVHFPAGNLMLLAGRNIAAECNGVQMAMIEDAGKRLVVGLRKDDTDPFHRFHKIGDRITQGYLIEYTCTTSALLALVRNEINGYYCTLEYRWTALIMFPIIEALGGKGKFDFVSTENDQPFAFACGNHAFILYVESLFGVDTGSTIA